MEKTNKASLKYKIFPDSKKGHWTVHARPRIEEVISTAKMLNVLPCQIHIEEEGKVYRVVSEKEFWLKEGK